ncbi:hypothetical protein JOF53_000002 [Crossiella equi]|uniref:DUF1828 domain-containing protein n=1 Tax=Crossiella equi TaxID=130796 RepID=A0ABS5A5X9_9PSEU|nr:hypothetical protein [Crossiella equi]MBP2471130.1 hypothetical protein [Crossiella equi]
MSARKLVRQATEFRFPLWPDEPDDGSPRQAVTVLVADWDEDVEGQRWAVRHDGASFTATGRGVAEDRLLSGVPVDGGLRFSRDEALAVALQVVLPRVREYWESVRQDGRDTRSTDG